MPIRRRPLLLLIALSLALAASARAQQPPSPQPEFNDAQKWVLQIRETIPAEELAATAAPRTAALSTPGLTHHLRSELEAWLGVDARP